MLLKNKLSIFVILAILISSIASAALLCQVEEVRTSLKKSLYEFLTNPSASTLSLEQIKDLLIFYLNIPEGAITANCSTEIIDIMNQAESISDITTCSDGTAYGECSSLKPEYCYAGTLINQCETCGCPDGELCDIPTSQCTETTENITCNVNSNCGTNNYISGYFCSNDNVYRNYSTFTCNNPNTPNSSCTDETTTVLIETCPSYCIEPLINCPYGSCANGVCMELGLGPELVTCWHFYCDSPKWIEGDNWEVAGEERDGIARYYEEGEYSEEVARTLQQDINVEPGKKYRVKIWISKFTSDCYNGLWIELGGTATLGMRRAGTYTYNMTAPTTGNLKLLAEGEECEPGDITEIYVYTLSVREILN